VAAVGHRQMFKKKIIITTNVEPVGRRTSKPKGEMIKPTDRRQQSSYQELYQENMKDQA
jgi:hypothetical protein